MKGPFYVKVDDKYILSELCKEECALWFFPDYDEKEEEEEEVIEK